MKIKEIRIKRYRSILDLKLEIDSLDEIATICGANNVGKTNVLKAVNLFFNSEQYDSTRDSPNHKFYGSRGGKVYPEILLVFQSTDKLFSVKKEFGLDGLESTTGTRTFIGTKNTKNLTEIEINEVIKKIAFFFIPSINVSTPDLINSLVEDIYDIEYDKSRFRGLKQQLKESFENYINGIVEILNSLAGEINPLFQEFNDNWQVGFEFTSDVKKFRDLISTDIDFFLNDKSNRHISGKGSGLQRIGYILLHSRIISKISKRTPILLIDEPDVYLHQGLQKKLHVHLKSMCGKCQIILTTHSPIFIDSYSLVNVFLLDLEIGDKQLYKRTNKEFYALRTVSVDLNNDSGFKRIREYLGISLDDFELLDGYNVMVEGGSDLRYIQELGRFYSFEVPNIITTHGVTKYEKQLAFYNTFYKDKDIRPKIRVLFDNDMEGREAYKKIIKNQSKDIYKYIEVKCEFIPTYSGEFPTHENVIGNKVFCNHEIEDFIYPEVFLELANNILGKRNFKKVNISDLKAKIEAKAFKEKGILNNFDICKNESNPEDGNQIDFSNNTIKEGLAKQFTIEGNKKMADKITKLDQKHAYVKMFIKELCEVF
ncbi:ATP-dependent endonuclease [Lewinella sp. LCG006]|uniref:ATP-dependent nuclease n=1 Tax=Lewinella sp. LCG006 TaxID=3231911 RepID=UPI00345FF489